MSTVGRRTRNRAGDDANARFAFTVVLWSLAFLCLFGLFLPSQETTLLDTVFRGVGLGTNDAGVRPV